MELAEGGGLPSYPHPYLMPDFWQFPTVSMGLGPTLLDLSGAIYPLSQSSWFAQTEQEPRVWAFIGDGETDEPETLGFDQFGRARKSGQFDVGRELQPATSRRSGSRE